MSPIGLNANSCQQQRVILPDGSSYSFTIALKPMQLGWFITELTYNDFTVRGLRVVVSPNLLYQFKNELPFGLACYSVGNREPSLISDFASGAATLYTLDSDEVKQLARLISGQAGA